MTLKLGIVAGELSGDRLGESLVTALRQRVANDTVEICGVGGAALESVGLDSLVDLNTLSMHGFAEPVKRLPFLWQTLKRIEEQMLAQRVDVFLGVDFNVFNLLLEARLKRAGIPVVHYVSPSVYAWRRGRTRRVARSCDVLLTLFPFEPPLYAEQPLRAKFVGHPLADEIDPQEVALAAAQRARSTTVTLMPGSRRSEVEQMLPVFLQTAVLVHQQRSSLQFVIPCATPAIEAQIKQELAAPIYGDLPIELTQGGARQVLAGSVAALIKSGTSTLEAMLLGVPMVVAYRLPPVTYNIVRRLLRTRYVALPNILAGEELVPELLQNEMQPPRLAQALMAQLSGERGDALGARFASIHQQLRCNASVSAASEVLALAQNRGYRL